MLEIRVHGVSNTPPQSTLQEWRPTPPPWDAPAPPEPLLVDGDRDTSGFYRRPGYEPYGDLVVEAYSWGQLTQGKRLGRKDLRRAAWALLLPFALANVAVWAVPGRDGKRSPVGQFVARCLALSLTVTFALGFAGVSMSEVAWQCGDRATGCAHTVPYTGFLREGWFSVGMRPVAVAMLVPMLAIGVLYLIARRSFAYEAQVPAAEVGSAGANEFRRSTFWTGTSQVRCLARLHLAAALTTVALLATGGAASLGGQNRGLFQAETVLLVVVAITIVTYLAHPAVRSRQPAPAELGATPGAVPLALAVLGWAGAFGTLLARPAVVRSAEAPQWPQLSGSVSALFCVQVLAVIALALVATTFWWRVAVAVPLLVAVALAVRNKWDGLGVVALVAAGVAVVVLLIAPTADAYRALDPPAETSAGTVEQPYDGLAWRGKAAALFAGAGLMLAVVYMAAALTATANYLNGPHAVTSTSAVVHVPTALLWAGLGLIAALTGVAVVGLAVWWLRFRPAVAAAEADLLAGPPLPPYEQARAQQVARARALHRFDGWSAVPMLGALAAVGLVICVFGALLTVLGLDPSGTTGSTPNGDSLLTRLTDIGGSISAFVIVLIGALLMTIYRSDGPVRHVFGVVWDLATFWPRAAHPFAPPCYAERAVPQLITKIAGQNGGTILACHSQGTLIGLATIFQLCDADARQVRFLTYGTQLNRLYGRIFPLFCGRLERDALADHLGQPAGFPGLPVPSPSDWRWVSLWRPTDFIGWSVGSRALDVEVADPVDLTGPPGQISLPVMHKHSDYPLSEEFVHWRNAMCDSFDA